jgi:hypothetical protein
MVMKMRRRISVLLSNGSTRLWILVKAYKEDRLSRHVARLSRGYKLEQAMWVVREEKQVWTVVFE